MICAMPWLLLVSGILQFIKRLGQLIGSKERGEPTRGYTLDDRFATALTELARDQKRDQKELYESVLKAGIDEVLRHDKYSALWETLSPREQDVTALICLGYSSSQIADILTISYDTVRSHTKHIYAKFGLKRKGLRQALAGWHFAEWWEKSQQH